MFLQKNLDKFLNVVKKNINILNKLGFILTLLSIYFLFTKLDFHSEEILQITQLNNSHFFFLTFIILISVASNFFLVKGFYNILKFANTFVNFYVTLRLYSGSQIWKYLPGNFFHFIKRNIDSLNLKLDQKKMTMATIKEMQYLIMSCLILSIIAYNLLSTLVLFILFIYFKQYKFNLFPYILFFLTQFFIFTLIANYLFGIDSSRAFLIAWCLSWIVGFVTPGSPGGIGIRELALINILSAISNNIMNVDAIISSLVIYRIVYICSDLFFFIFSFLKFNTAK